jgi:hypothetical protein
MSTAKAAHPTGMMRLSWRNAATTMATARILIAAACLARLGVARTGVNLAARNIEGRTMAAANSNGVCELGAMRSPLFAEQ